MNLFAFSVPSSLSLSFFLSDTRSSPTTNCPRSRAIYSIFSCQSQVAVFDQTRCFSKHDLLASCCWRVFRFTVMISQGSRKSLLRFSRILLKGSQIWFIIIFLKSFFCLGFLWTVRKPIVDLLKEVTGWLIVGGEEHAWKDSGSGWQVNPVRKQLL